MRWEVWKWPDTDVAATLPAGLLLLAQSFAFTFERVMVPSCAIPQQCCLSDLWVLVLRWHGCGLPCLFLLYFDSSSKDAVIFLAETAQHNPSEHPCGASSLSSPSSPSSPVFASHTLPCCSLTPYSSSSFLIKKTLWPVLLQAPPFHKVPCAPWGAQACTHAASVLPLNQGSQCYAGTGWIVLVCSAWPVGCIFSALGPPCAWPWAALAARSDSGSVQQNTTLGLGYCHRNFSWLQLVNGSWFNNVNSF